MNRKIIVALIFIILIVLAGLLVFSNGGNGKTDTQINFLTGNNVKNGDVIQFELKDAQGNALANQNVTITFEYNGQAQKFSIITDSQGRGGLRLQDEESGNHNLTVSYIGDDTHNGCTANQIITIGDESSESSTESAPASTQSNQSTASTPTSEYSSTNLNYDSELNVYYDSNGKVVGGQNDGADYETVKNNPQQVDEEGNLV